MPPYLYRNKDVILGNSDLEPLYTLKKFPVFMGCVNTPEHEDLLVDMSWQISQSSGAIQLNPLLPLDIVYMKSHGSGTIGKLWNAHHEAFANFIARYKPKSIFEIGAQHGILASKYFELHNKIDWTIIEPNPHIDPALPVKVIEEFFDNEFKSNKHYDAIVHSHVLGHMYDPNTFMQHIASFMKKDD